MKRLYTPFKVNKLELKNRVIMSPMSIGHTVDGFIMDDVVEFYKRRAQGGGDKLVSQHKKGSFPPSNWRRGWAGPFRSMARRGGDMR